MHGAPLDFEGIKRRFDYNPFLQVDKKLGEFDCMKRAVLDAVSLDMAEIAAAVGLTEVISTSPFDAAARMDVNPNIKILNVRDTIAAAAVELVKGNIVLSRLSVVNLKPGRRDLDVDVHLTRISSFEKVHGGIELAATGFYAYYADHAPKQGIWGGYDARNADPRLRYRLDGKCGYISDKPYLTNAALRIADGELRENAWLYVFKNMPAQNEETTVGMFANVVPTLIRALS